MKSMQSDIDSSIKSIHQAQTNVKLDFEKLKTNVKGSTTFHVIIIKKFNKIYKKRNHNK